MQSVAWLAVEGIAGSLALRRYALPGLAALVLATWLALAAWPAWAAEPPITALEFVPDGSALLAGSQAGVAIVSWPELKPLGKLHTALAHVHDMRFDRAGRHVALAGGSPAESGGVEIFSWPEAKRLGGCQAGGDLVYALAWSADGATLAAASFDQQIRLIDPVRVAVRQALEGHSRGVSAVAFLEDGQTLLSASHDQSLRVWDLAAGKPLRSLDNHTQGITDLAVRPGEHAGPPLVATAGLDKTVRLWQPTIGRMVRFRRGTTAAVALAWSHEGRYLVAATTDGQVQVLEPDALEVQHQQQALQGRAHCLRTLPARYEAAVGGENGQIRRVVWEGR
jgi:WD40 repeat protein